ncbi:MAG: hypothetical protein EBX99_07850 [Acidimicrobiia bacterium]|jgi:hypothetical protein|nr:hypothetical protein [Actinomycetota bacterium]NDB06388.1 hypothetical protein [Acidimicrobiia bacterium]NDA78646.1 hypothetical protein [Actinomycetota bacterium]NDD96341.1 hypothetical protein [Actinomycetota bacterium]NDE80280.1 hypothetical protein [Actinomycetota bacterium]
MAASNTKNERVSRQDIENKLRALQGDVQNKVEDRRSSLLAIAGGVGVALVVVFFLLGRRSGKRRSTVVEIRRL